MKKTEADIVRMIFDWYLSGHNVLAIRKELQKREAKAPKGKRKVNQGEYDRFTLEKSHPAIIQKDVFEKVQAIQLERSNVVQGESGSTRKNTRYSMKKARHIASKSAENPITFD